MANRFPQRQRVELDGTWRFQVEGEDQQRTITVPLPWEAAFPELRDRPITATYERSIRVPAAWRSSIVRLHVGAADYYSEVSVNGYLVGVNEGGYLPFVFEVQDFLRPGEDNLIRIRVVDNAPARMVTGEGALTPETKSLTAARPFPFTEIPHGKQSWYATVGGIWQSVFLERCPDTFVDNVFVRPDVARQAASVRVRLAHPPLDEEGYTLHLTAEAPDGGTPVPPVEVPLTTPRQTSFDLLLKVPSPTLWDMDHPHLYTLTVEVRLAGKAVDSFVTRFGMRSIESREGQILLNGHPIFLAGALDQDFYPGTIYTPPSTAYLRDQFQKAKEMGLNLLRCHIKTPDPRYLDLCDEMGLMVWYEIPNWAVLTQKSGKRGREHLEEMLERDYNHASLLILTIMNESWGIDLTKRWQREWLEEMYDYAKQLDPTRLIVDNSACVGNYHVKSDIDDYHVYYAIPDHADKWASWCADFASRPRWTYTPFGDAKRTKQEPLILSEFGNWGLPTLRSLQKGYDGAIPWWFHTGAGAARPEGLADRFKQYGLDRIWPSYDRMAEATQEQQWLSLKYEIETMRRHSGIVGYVITEFTDLHWEANGLLDFCRSPKVFHRRLKDLQSQDLLIPLHEKSAFWGGDKFRLPLLLSHFSRTDLKGASLRWRVREMPETSGGFVLNEAPQIGTSGVGEVTFTVPDLKDAQTVTLEICLDDAAGKRINTNEERFSFFPAAAKRLTLEKPVFVYDPLKLFPQNVVQNLTDAGLRIASELSEGVLCLASVADETMMSFIREGGDAVLLALDRDSLPRTTSGLASVSRDKNGWWGDWCSGLNWFRPDGAKRGGPFEGLPHTAPFDFSFRKIIPRRVLVGWNPEKEAEDIWAGIFVGWVRLPATLVGGFRYGKGKVLATTFNLLRSAEDPVSRVLLGSLLGFAASDRFDPQKSVAMERLELSHTLLAAADIKGETWRYTTVKPAENWTAEAFDDKRWRTGRAGFGQGLSQATTRTKWKEDNIYLRIELTVPPEGVQQAHLRCFHDDDVEIFLNGEPLLTRSGYTTEYEDFILAPDQVALFQPGCNVLAVHCQNVHGPQYIDVGITVELKGSPVILPPAGRNGVTQEAHEETDAAVSSQQMAAHEERTLQTTGSSSGKK